MRKKFVRGLAYVMCATLAITAVPPWAVYAESETEVSGSNGEEVIGICIVK